MAITVELGASREALTFNKIHLCKLTIMQSMRDFGTQAPTYNVVVEYKLFAVDTQDNIYYEDRARKISLPDYLKIAAEKAAAGDSDLLNAIGAIEFALASIIEDQTVFGTATVTQ